MQVMWPSPVIKIKFDFASDFKITLSYIRDITLSYIRDTFLPYHARIQGGAKGALAPPPSPQNIAPPNSEARAKRALAPPPGGQEGLGPPLTKSWIRLCIW